MNWHLAPAVRATQSAREGKRQRWPLAKQYPNYCLTSDQTCLCSLLCIPGERSCQGHIGGAPLDRVLPLHVVHLDPLPVGLRLRAPLPHLLDEEGLDGNLEAVNNSVPLLHAEAEVLPANSFVMLLSDWIDDLPIVI